MSRIADPKNANQRSVTVSADTFRILRAASYHGGLKMVTIVNELVASAAPELEKKYGFSASEATQSLKAN